MTSEVKLSLKSTGGSTLVSVDLTNLGVSVSHIYNNPLIVIPTPVGPSPSGATPQIGANIKGINIGFVTNRYSLRFTLLDGLGTLNFGGSGTTNYEKIVYMTNSRLALNPKTLTLNGIDMKGHIESFNITFAAGDKDMALNCSLNFIATDNIEMGTT